MKSKLTKFWEYGSIRTGQIVLLGLACWFCFSPRLLTQDALQDYAYQARLCESLTKAKQYEKALTACNSAVALNAKDPLIWGLIAEVSLVLARYPEVLTAYEKLLRFDPNQSIAQMGRCEAFFHLQQYQDAIAACESALKIEQNWQDTSPQRAWYFRGEAFRELKQPENALFSYDWAIQLQSNYAPAWVGRCRVLFEEKMYQDALSSCQTASQDGASWDGFSVTLPWLYEGKIYNQLQQYPQALQAYEKALAFAPQEVSAWSEQAEILIKVGEYQRAWTAINWAINLSPDDSLVLTQKCAILNHLNQSQPTPSQGDYNKALESCDRALQEGNDRWGDFGPAYAWNQRGNALIGLERYPEALVSLEQAIALQPDYGDAWNNRGVVLSHLKQYSEALGSVKRAISINLNDSDAWFNKGIILVNLQQYERAITAYDRALSGNINFRPPSAKANIFINQSAVFWRLQLYQRALITAQNALELNPEKLSQIMALYNKSLALMSLQEYEQALEALSQLLEIEPNHPQAQQFLKYLESRL